MKLVKNAERRFCVPYLPEKYFLNQVSNTRTVRVLINP